MLADVIVADRKLHTEVNMHAHDWLVIESAKQGAADIIRELDLNPHPLRLVASFVTELYFDKVPRLVP